MKTPSKSRRHSEEQSAITVISYIYETFLQYQDVELYISIHLFTAVNYWQKKDICLIELHILYALCLLSLSHREQIPVWTGKCSSLPLDRQNRRHNTWRLKTRVHQMLWTALKAQKTFPFHWASQIFALPHKPTKMVTCDPSQVGKLLCPSRKRNTLRVNVCTGWLLLW